MLLEALLTSTQRRGTDVANELSPEERRALRGAVEVLSMMTAIKPNIPAYQIITLLTVAMEEGKSVKKYSELLALPTATMSRTLLDLGKMSRSREPGMGLMEEHTAPNNLREHEMYLTAKGRALIRRMVGRLMQ